MAVVFVSAGSASGTIGNPTPGIPAGSAAGDIEMMHVYVRDTANAPTVSGTWSLISGPVVLGTGGTPARMWLYGRILSGAAGSETVTIGASNAKLARRYLFRDNAGAYAGSLSSFLQGLVTGENLTTSPADVPDVTTTVTNTLLVAFFAGTDDGLAIGPPTGWTEPVAEAATSAGADGTISIAHKTRASTGTESVDGFSVSPTGDRYATIGLAIEPAVAPSTGAIRSFAVVVG